MAPCFLWVNTHKSVPSYQIPQHTYPNPAAFIPLGLSSTPDTEELKSSVKPACSSCLVVSRIATLMSSRHVNVWKRIRNLTNYSYSTEQKYTNFSLRVVLVVSVGLQHVNLSQHFWVECFSLKIVRFFMWWPINCRTNSMQLWYPQYPAAELSEQVHTFHFLSSVLLAYLSLQFAWVFALCCCHSERMLGLGSK